MKMRFRCDASSMVVSAQIYEYDVGWHYPTISSLITGDDTDGTWTDYEFNPSDDEDWADSDYVALIYILVYSE